MTKTTTSFPSQVTGVAGYVAHLRPGERAELRRLETHRDRIPPEVFWRIVDRYGIHAGAETFWMAILPLIVRHSHRTRPRLGRALRDSGVSKVRVERWLRLTREGALRESKRVFEMIDGGFDWVSTAYLLRGWKERDRRQLARDYFIVGSHAHTDSEHDNGDSDDK